jgi:hypothetical protein
VVLHWSSLHFLVHAAFESSQLTAQSSPLTLVVPHALNIAARIAKVAPP